MEERYCQSCGMPMGETDEMYGTEKDGSKSRDYCSYCYEDGAFKWDCSMEEMISQCVQPMVAANPGMSEEEARNGMLQWLPKLKRWQDGARE